MTVAEASAKYGVTKQAVYQQIKKLENNGKIENTGLLTDEAIDYLESLYSEKSEETIKLLTIENNDLKTENESLKLQIDRFRSQVAAMQDEINNQIEEKTKLNQVAQVLTVKQQAAEEKARGLESERDFLREQLSKAITPALPEKTTPSDKVTFRQAIAMWLNSGKK